MLNLGQFNTLTAFRETDNGIYLVDDKMNEVLLPNIYVPKDIKKDDTIEVFLYNDSEDRFIATTIIPKIQLHEYALLRAKAVNDIGAFFDWGLTKDLLVPYSQQAKEIIEGRSYVVYLYVDELTQRLVGTTKIKNTFKDIPVELEVGDEVDILAYGKSDLGISVIVDNKYRGMLFENELFEEIIYGDRKKAYVKNIRPDNKIDLSLNRLGYVAVDDNIQRVIDELNANKGFLALHDKSSPDDIYEQLGMSKKIFKKVIGALYKQKQIEITDKGVKLL